MVAWQHRFGNALPQIHPRKQITRTHLLLRTGSDYSSLVHRNKTFPFHPHPYGARLERKRTLPRAKNSPPDCFYGSCAAAALSSPAWRIKNGVSPKGYTVFGTPEGTRTPNPRNRNPMLYPLSHWRISESPIIIAGFPGFVKRKWKNFLLPADSFCANGCFSQ